MFELELINLLQSQLWLQLKWIGFEATLDQVQFQLQENHATLFLIARSWNWRSYSDNAALDRIRKKFSGDNEWVIMTTYFVCEYTRAALIFEFVCAINFLNWGKHVYL